MPRWIQRLIWWIGIDAPCWLRGHEWGSLLRADIFEDGEVVGERMFMVCQKCLRESKGMKHDRHTSS